MRPLLFATIVLLIAFIIKTDLQKGSLPLASFYEDNQNCEQEIKLQYVKVRVAANDTIYSLFATTSSPVEMPMHQRLTDFYQLNPHLIKQSFQEGELILLPIYTKNAKKC